MIFNSNKFKSEVETQIIDKLINGPDILFSSPKFTELLVNKICEDDKNLSKLAQKVDEHRTRKIVEDYEDHIKNLRIEERERYNSPEPWVNVFSRGHNSDKGIELELFWNPAFIAYLKANNIDGDTEEDAVQNWLALLNIDILADNF